MSPSNRKRLDLSPADIVSKETGCFRIQIGQDLFDCELSVPALAAAFPASMGSIL